MTEPHVGPMDITGKPMKGWILVAPEGAATEDQVTAWVRRAAKFVGTLAPK